MPKSKMNIHIVLDRSGSMASCREQTISGVNEYLLAIKSNADLKAKVSLTLFDSVGVDLIWNRAKPEELSLDEKTFVPRALTPLNDAIGKTIAHIDGLELKPETLVTLVIVTDGQENASVKYSTDQIKDLITAKEKAGWMIVYLGANQDAFAEGAAIGMSAYNTMNYATMDSCAAFGAVAEATAMYSSTRSAGKAAFTDDQRKAAVGQK